MTGLPHTGWSLITSLLSAEELSLTELQQVGEWEVYLDAGVIGNQTILRSRRPGDKFYPLGMGGRTKKINEFMIDKKIPVSWRDHIPLLVSDQHILWICGYRPDEQARVTDATQQVIHLKFEYINSNKDRLQDMSG
jgi:tRNA(Ile)-lysidine synthase